MTYMMQLDGTMEYWLAAERAERERAGRRAQLVAEARRRGEPTTPEPPRRRSLIPRRAGALGLV